MTREKIDEKEVEKEIIAVESAEGRPAHPQAGGKTLGIILLLSALVLVVVSLILGFMMGQAIAALAIAGFALLIFITNPEVWATILRSKERREISERRNTPQEM